MGLIARVRDYIGLTSAQYDEAYEALREDYSPRERPSRYAGRDYADSPEPEVSPRGYSHSVETLHEVPCEAPRRDSHIPVHSREVPPEPRPSSFNSRVTPIAQPAEPLVETIRLHAYAEVTNIGAAIRAGSYVVFSLEEMKHDEARRVIDFVAGVCWACDYSFKKARALVFSASPKDAPLEERDLNDALAVV